MWCKNQQFYHNFVGISWVVKGKQISGIMRATMLHFRRVFIGQVKNSSFVSFLVLLVVSITEIVFGITTTTCVRREFDQAQFGHAQVIDRIFTGSTVGEASHRSIVKGLGQTVSSSWDSVVSLLTEVGALGLQG